MALAEWWTVVGYVIVGIGGWGIVWFAMVKGRARLDLRRKPLADPDPWPRVAVIVPCRNEADHIRACVGSLLAQDYPDLQVIIVNDRSTDATPAALTSIRDPRLRVVHVTEADLPDGWFGKTYAMHVGARAADAQWLVFTDSDTRLAPAAVREGVRLGVGREFDLVSFVPRFHTRGFADRLMTPVGGIVTSAMYTMMYANSANLPSVAFACGQYMAIRRTAYDAIGGWGAVRQYPSDDVEIARVLKRAGLRPRVGWGLDLVDAHMYDTWPTVWRGWSRNLIMASRGKPWRALGVVAFIVACVFSAFAALAWGVFHAQPVWVITSILHMLLITVVLVSAYRRGGFDPRYALLWPISAVLLLAILGRSLYLCAIGRMDWRGVSYSLRMK
jgi:chlorobactene glucosyltransferase